VRKLPDCRLAAAGRLCVLLLRRSNGCLQLGVACAYKIGDGV
jgi:hypothetical protein